MWLRTLPATTLVGEDYLGVTLGMHCLLLNYVCMQPSCCRMRTCPAPASNLMRMWTIRMHS